MVRTAAHTTGAAASGVDVSKLSAVRWGGKIIEIKMVVAASGLIPLHFMCLDNSVSEIEKDQQKSPRRSC